MSALRAVLMVVLLAAGLWSGPALAQEWPTKPVRMVVAFPPGGSTDIAARVVSDYLTRNLKQTFLVENRGGAAGNIGNEHVAKSAPDGYTFLVSTDGIASSSSVYKLAFNPLTELQPVIQLSRQPNVLAAHPSLRVKTIGELIALAKSKPGLSSAHAGVGTGQHICGEWFSKLAGITLTQVPYKGGGQAINDLVSGQIPLGFFGSSPLMPHYRTGKLILLAQTTKARAPTLPDVPTFEQAGIAGLLLEQWLGVAAPRGTPAAVVQRLNEAIAKALADPGVLERFNQAGLEAVGGTVAQFAALIAEDAKKYARLTQELGIKAE